MTGKEEELKEEDVDKVVDELAPNRMAITKLKPPPDDGMGSSDIAMCKLIRKKRKDSGAILVLLYKCHMRNES